MLQKKMFKVVSPIERKDGTTYWMRVGVAFPNKDDSINVYLDAIPKDLKFQVREYSEEDLRERDARRAARPAPSAAAMPSLASADGVPF